MKKHLLVLCLLGFSVAVINAQSDYKAPYNARYTPSMTEAQLYDITFLQKMSKEDWNRFTKDPRFDGKKVAKIKTEWKEAHAGGHPHRKSLQSSSEINCNWIDPTPEYEHPNTINWPGSPGNSTDNFSAVINLGWTFNYFGQAFTQVVLTTKGTIVLGNAGYIDFTPSSFPTPLGTETAEQHDHICGFWTDFDFGAIGDLYYNLTPEGLYVNYIDVGYWPGNSDRTNSMQMIITPDGSTVIGGGNNVQFTYLDMQFCNSQISGATGGCGANNNIANVGCDRVTGTCGFQFGRFNYCDSDVYNGPFGVTAAQQDGVDWLDGRVIQFNTSITSCTSNQPPIAIGEACDTITMCIGEVFHFNLAFTSPEAAPQSTSISYVASGVGFTTGTTPGNYATLNDATFVASAGNVGSNTLTITATDTGSPAQSTVITYTFLVQDEVPPPIAITGVLSICAGQETELTASDGFDSYEWSNGDFGQTAFGTNPGLITVIGHSGNCSAVATVMLEVTPYFIPPLEGGNIPIEMCPGMDTSICVLGDYVTYDWYIYPGYDGEFVTGTPTDGPCAQVTGNVNGTYGIIVTDENGCEGLNIKNVHITESFIDEANDDNNGAYCEGLESVDFFGGFSNPAEDNLIVYGLSTNANGWQGSYINIILYPADGGDPETTFFTTFGPVATIDDVMIGVGDSIVIEYFANGNNFAGNSLWVINCGSSTPTIIPSPLLSGVVWSGLSTCTSTPLEGDWTVTGPSGWNLTDDEHYNTTFTPTQYGVYQLCFTDPACNLDHCYDLEYNLPPTLNLSPGNNLFLCDSETSSTEIVISDVGGTGNISWSGTGITVSGDEMSADIGPYSGYTTTTVMASITNGCGTASDSFSVEHQPDAPEPSLSNQFLCSGSSLTLDPVPSSMDNPNLVYDWNPGTATTPTLNVSAVGSYTVTVSNDCDTSGPATAVISPVVAATITSSPDDNILECDDDTYTLSVNYLDAASYHISWNTSATTNSIVVDEDGNYCWTVSDNQGCNQTVTGCSNVDISHVPNTSSGGGDPLVLCPRECEELNLVAVGEDQSYSWSTSCGAYSISSGSATVNICGENVPLACLGSPMIITGTVTNECGSDQAQWTLQANACDIKIPNIFTPNGDAINNAFYIYGLENYTNVKLSVFNRWGNTVYESDNYRNNWTGGDLAEGTYWYTLVLPYGASLEHKGFFSIIR